MNSETVVFMSEMGDGPKPSETEMRQPRKDQEATPEVSLVKKGDERNVRPHGGGQPPEGKRMFGKGGTFGEAKAIAREGDPKAARQHIKEGLFGDDQGEEKTESPETAEQRPERADASGTTPEETVETGQGEKESGETSEDERQQEIIEDLEQGRLEDALRKQLEDRGFDPQELESEEMQQAVHDAEDFVEILNESEEHRDLEKWENAAKTLQKAPKEYQEIVRMMLRQHGVDEHEIGRLLPEVSAAPTKDDIEASPTGGDDGVEEAPTGELTEEEKGILQEFPDAINDARMRGDLDKMRALSIDLLKKIGRGAGKLFKYAAYVILAGIVTYIGLMAVTGKAVGKK